MEEDDTRRRRMRRKEPTKKCNIEARVTRSISSKQEEAWKISRGIGRG